MTSSAVCPAGWGPPCTPRTPRTSAAMSGSWAAFTISSIGGATYLAQLDAGSARQLRRGTGPLPSRTCRHVTVESYSSARAIAVRSTGLPRRVGVERSEHGGHAFVLGHEAERLKVWGHGRAARVPRRGLMRLRAGRRSPRHFRGGRGRGWCGIALAARACPIRARARGRSRARATRCPSRQGATLRRPCDRRHRGRSGRSGEGFERLRQPARASSTPGESVLP